MMTTLSLLIGVSIYLVRWEQSNLHSGGQRYQEYVVRSILPEGGYSVHKCTQEKDRYLPRASPLVVCPPKLRIQTTKGNSVTPHPGTPKEDKRNIPRALSGRWCVFSSLWPRRTIYPWQGSYIESYHGVDTIPPGATDLDRSCPCTKLHRATT